MRVMWSVLCAAADEGVVRMCCALTLCVACDREQFGTTALMKAAESGQSETCKALIEAGAEVNATKQVRDMCTTAAAGVICVVLCALTRCGCERKQSGRTALMEAASNSHTETCRALIDAGADVNAFDMVRNFSCSECYLRGIDVLSLVVAVHASRIATQLCYWQQTEGKLRRAKH